MKKDVGAHCDKSDSVASIADSVRVEAVGVSTAPSVGARCESSKTISSDPFDLENLKISQNFGETLGVKKQLTVVPVRRPDPQWWIQVHPDQKKRLPAATLTLKEDRETYIVAPSLCEHLSNEIRLQILLLAINRNKTPFIWGIQLPGADGKHNEWHRSALEAALNHATKGWVRIEADLPLGAYQVSTTIAQLEPPQWPDCSFQEIIKIAFRDRFIQDLDHPVIKKLRGLI